MTTPAQPPARGRGRPGALRNPVTWVILLGVALAGGAIILYRRNKANTATNAATAAPAPDQTDLQGQIATLQSEIANLQSTGAQDESAETGTGTGDTGGDDGTGTGKLTAPAGLSITPHAGFADFGWSKVPGAKAYELQVAGRSPGPGPSHYDHAGTGNHAERVALANGNYHARVRAGTSTTALSGPWSPWKDFRMGAARNPAPGSGRLVTGRVGGGGGESENDTGSG